MLEWALPDPVAAVVNVCVWAPLLDVVPVMFVPEKSWDIMAPEPALMFAVLISTV